jgi:cell wall assembly regulator SMI1
MNADVRPSVAASWRRIDTWLAAYSPTDLALLNPPVEPDRLEALERVLGVPVPDDLAESLRCHDGAAGLGGTTAAATFSDAWPSLAEYLHAIAEALTHGGGVRGKYPYLTSDGRLWWDDGPDCQILNGKPLTAAPTSS